MEPRSNVGILITRHPDQYSRIRTLMSCGKILRRRSCQTIVCLCIIQLTRVPAALAVGGHVLVSRDNCLGDSHGATRILTSALHCVVTVTVTSLRAHGILSGKIKSVAHQSTVSSEIDRVTIHELLLWLTSDMTLRSCLLLLRFLERD